MTETNVIAFPLVAVGQIGDDTVQTVNARDLHAFLGISTAFKDWIARRVSDYGFQEGRDFCSFLSESQGGRPAKEYALTIDMAKELSMVERNEQGKRARLYFIEMERRAKAAGDPIHLLNDPAAMRGLLLTYSEKVIALEAQVSDLSEKGEALDRIATADGSLNITEAAKALQMRPKDLFGWLRANGWIYRRAGGSHDLGYQSKTTAGLLEHKVTTVLRADGTEKITEQVRVTPKGLARLSALIKPAISAA
mgnify:CR=1 FL=1|jgi:anti-repressor protein